MRFVGAAWCVVSLACLVAAAPATAAPTPATESRLAEAKQHYAAATKFYDLAEYENALREFKEAYRAVEDPAFLFNIAQCHRKLGQNPDAITFYKTYLRRAPHAANRNEVERRIAELERVPTPAPAPAPMPAPAPTPAPDDPASPVAPLVLDLPPAPASTVVVSDQAAPADEAPFYRRGWFWIVTGAVIAGAATTLIVLSTGSDSAPFCPDCAGTTAITP